MKRPLLLDGRNLYDPAHMKAMGFEHIGIGRSESLPRRSHEAMPMQAWAA